jgi:hypothetical protein
MSDPQERTRWEEVRITGDHLVSTIKELIREGNVRRVVIKNEEGRVYLEIPLTVGVVGAVFLPVLAALGALAAVASGLTIAVEKIVPPGDTPGATASSGTPSDTDATPIDPTGDDGA